MAGSFEVHDYPAFLTFAPGPEGLPRTVTYPFIRSQKDDLAGKSVFITGASMGLGKFLAVGFAAAGCSNIAIASRSTERLQPVAEEVKRAAETVGLPAPWVLVLGVDVTVEADVKAAADAVAEAFGGALDILISNAGFLETYAYVLESDPLDWWQTWEVNMKGVYLCSRYFLPLVLKSELKTIVNMTSGMAMLLVPGNSAYSTVKMAICRYTENLSNEYSKDGLVALALEPGLVDTPMADKMHPAMHDLPKDDPVLVADTAVWLVKERREWLSGRIVGTRCDMEVLLSKKEEVVERDLLKFRIAAGQAGVGAQGPTKTEVMPGRGK